MLEQRLKKKEAYLKKLEGTGKYDPSRPTEPDPERWLPKAQRSTSRKNRKNNKGGKFVGAQGTGVGNNRDMGKLDAKARAEATASGITVDGTRSTANIEVSNGGKISRHKHLNR